MGKITLPSDEELFQLLNKTWCGELVDNYIRIGNCRLPSHYLQMKKNIDDFEVSDSDIWVCSFPKTGTTWMSEMVWLLANNCNFEKAKISMFERIRFVDFGAVFNFTKKPDLPECFTDTVNFAKNHPRPRVIKSHLPFDLLPKQIQSGEKKPKIIYIIRNPLDTCISFYYHAASMNYTGTLEEFYQLFLTGNMLYGDYWDHILQYWNVRNRDNVLLLKYEDMKKDLAGVIRKTATFLGKCVSDEELQQLQSHLSFESMKKNSSVNGGDIFSYIKSGKIKSDHIRKGVVGGYKEDMPQEYVELFQSWMKDKFGGTGIEF